MDKPVIKLDFKENNPPLQEEVFVRDIAGLFQTTNVLPTYTPRSIYEQVVLYDDGVDKHLYFYDGKSNSWVKFTED